MNEIKIDTNAARRAERDPYISSSAQESLANLSAIELAALRVTTTVKRCPRCGETKSTATEFYKDRGSRGGWDYLCKVCRTAQVRAIRKNRRARLNRVRALVWMERKL